MVGREALVRPATNVELKWKPVTFYPTDEIEQGRPLWKSDPESLTWDCVRYRSVKGDGYEINIMDEIVVVETPPFESIYGDITLSGIKIIFAEEPSNEEAIEGLQNILLELV